MTSELEFFFLYSKMTPETAKEPLGDIGIRNTFNKLVSDLSKILGPSSGLDSSDIDIHTLRQLMEDYKSSEDEWAEYAFQDLSRGYTRNLVDEGNSKSNLVSSRRIN